jgi:hypothetical protein
MRSLALTFAPVGIAATSSFAPESLFKYMYTSSVMEQTASYLGGDPLTIGEIDNYIYHSSLLILFKFILRTTPLNNEYFLACLSHPALRKQVVDSDLFQECKKICALKILLMLAKQKGASSAKKIVFLWLKSYLNETPLKHLIKEIDEDTPFEKILFLFENSLEKMYRLKKTEATLLIDDLTSEFQDLQRGEIDLTKLITTADDAYTFIQNFSTDSPQSISLFSTKAIAYAVGQLALYSGASPLAICANLSTTPTITELSFRISGALAACFYPGLATTLATEALVKFLAPRIAKELKDTGKEIESRKRALRDVHDGFVEETRLTRGETLREIQRCETLFFEVLAASALALIGKSLHPAVQTLTSVHLIQNLESNTSIVTPSKKIDLISAMTIQAPVALGLTLLHETVFQGPGSRAFLNIAALAITHPFVMNKLIETEAIKEASLFVREQIPGLKESDRLAPVEAAIDIAAPLITSKIPLAHHAPTAIRAYKATRVIKRISDHLGGVEAITTRSRQAATSTLALYGNYATFTMTSSALGPEIGVAVLGAGVGKGLSKTTMAASVVAGGIVYTYTQSPAITCLVVTALQAVSQTPFAARAVNRARELFRRFF